MASQTRCPVLSGFSFDGLIKPHAQQPSNLITSAHCSLGQFRNTQLWERVHAGGSDRQSARALTVGRAGRDLFRTGGYAVQAPYFGAADTFGTNRSRPVVRTTPYTVAAAWIYPAARLAVRLACVPQAKCPRCSRHWHLDRRWRRHPGIPV